MSTAETNGNRPSADNVDSEVSVERAQATQPGKGEASFQSRSWKRACAMIGLLILIAISMLPFFLIGSSLRNYPIMAP